MATVKDELQKGGDLLAEAGIAEARRDAMSLIAFALKRSRTFLYTHPEHMLSPAESELIDSLFVRRAAHEPIQYITGIQEFCGLEFDVSPDVLIPRPETEMVVETAIEILQPASDAYLCEVGVGSGCISISILHRLTELRATGLDISAEALAVAEQNARRHGVDKRFRLVRSDLFAAAGRDRFDMIVSNPPYVPERDLAGLQAEVRDFEPRIALTGGADGLDVIRRIVTDAPEFLRPGGYLMMEIGYDQSARVTGLFDQTIWAEPRLFPDLQGIPRLVLSRLI